MNYYYSYDPNGDFEFYEDESAAKAAFEEAIQTAKDELADNCSDDNISDISWGVVRQSVRFDDREPSEDEKPYMGDADFIREISVLDHGSPQMNESDTPRTDAAEWIDEMCSPSHVVESIFSRQLERELKSVTEQRDTLAEALKEAVDKCLWRSDSEFPLSKEESQRLWELAVTALATLNLSPEPILIPTPEQRAANHREIMIETDQYDMEGEMVEIHPICIHPTGLELKSEMIKRIQEIKKDYANKSPLPIEPK